MPQVPTYQSNQNVMPEVVSQPRLGAEAFGGGQWQQIGQLAQAGEKMGSAFQAMQIEQSKVDVRQKLNDYRIGLEQIKTGITSDMANYSTASKTFSEKQKELQDATTKSFGEDKYAQSLFSEFANEHNISTYKSVFGWQEEMTKQNDKMQKERQVTLNAQFSTSADDNDYKKLKSDSIGVYRALGYDEANAQGATKDAFKKAVIEQTELLVKGQDYMAAKKLIDNSLTRGDITSAEHGSLDAKIQDHTKTVDGTPADPRSKDRLNSLKALASDNTADLANTSYDDLKGLAVEDYRQGKELLDKARVGYPLNPIDVSIRASITNSMKGIFVDANNREYVKDAGTGAATDVSLFNKEGQKAFKYVREQVYRLPADKRTDADAIQKIVDDAQKETMAFDASGAKIQKKYQIASYEANDGQYKREANNAFNLGGIAKVDEPKGTRYIQSFDGKDTGFYKEPDANGSYKIYDIKNKKYLPGLYK